MWNNQGGDQSYGGDQGGGYLTSQAGSQFGSPMSQERKARQRAQNIMPVTVAQVLAAEQQEEKFVLDNIELHQVTLVGIVRSVKEAATRIDYEIDDMSSLPLEVRQFVDNDENSPDEERTIPMRENIYVRVFGHVRAFGGKKSVVAFKIIPLMDVNELTTHLLEVMHSHMYLTKIQGAAGGTMASTVSGTYDSGMQQNTYPGAQTDNLDGLTPLQRQVSLTIKSCRDEHGISAQQVSEKLRGVPKKAILDAIDFLSNEGHIYSTIDDEHYKSTDATE